MKKQITLILVALLIQACANNNSELKNQESLNRLQILRNADKGKTKVSAFRAQAIKDTAMSLGARGGLAFRSVQINKILSDHEPYLNRIFNFRPLVLNDNVLSPVLLEGRHSLKISGDAAIRINDRNYQIYAQARFITAPPTWRDYLWLNYLPPDSPHKSLLPKNTEERVLWKYFVAEGWTAGLMQADTIYRENLSRIKRDMEGMIRYKHLLMRNMVSPPYVAKLELGITGGGQDLTINDRVLRITSFPALINQAEDWKTEIIKHE